MRGTTTPSLHLLFRAIALLVSASPASADYPWPVDGAPVCVEPGDQQRPVWAPSGCSYADLRWLDSGGTSGGVNGIGISAQPPTGVCPAGQPASFPRDLSVARVEVPIILGFPGCLGPATAALWIEAVAGSEALVMSNQYWFPSPFHVVDEGVTTRTHPRFTGSGLNANYWDTAAVVVWSDDRAGVPQVRAQRISQSGAREWGEHGIVLVPTTSPQTEPGIVRLQDGGVLVTWLDARDGGSDVYALKLLPDGSVAPGWSSAGLALEARVEVAASLRLVGGGTSALPAYAIWEETGPRAGAGRLVVARRLLPDGTPDPGWSVLGVALSNLPTVEGLQDAAMDSYLGLQAVWTDTRAASPSNPTDLYAQQLTSSGVPVAGWAANGLAICTAPGRQDHASMDASVYTVYAWEDSRGADVDVYASLRYPGGVIPCCEWLADGLPATQAIGDQTRPVVAAGNIGGAFVAWEDGRDAATNGRDVYAQAFSSDGRKVDVPASPRAGAGLLRLPAPNPARGPVRLAVEMPAGATLRLDVLDILGRRVATLANGAFAAGPREFVWDGRDDQGRKMPAGLYSVRARSGGHEDSRALVRLD